MFADEKVIGSLGIRVDANFPTVFMIGTCRLEGDTCLVLCRIRTILILKQFWPLNIFKDHHNALTKKIIHLKFLEECFQPSQAVFEVITLSDRLPQPF